MRLVARNCFGCYSATTTKMDLLFCVFCTHERDFDWAWEFVWDQHDGNHHSKMNMIKYMQTNKQQEKMSIKMVSSKWEGVDNERRIYWYSKLHKFLGRIFYLHVEERRKKNHPRSPINMVMSAKLKNNPIYFRYYTQYNEWATVSAATEHVLWPSCALIYIYNTHFYRSMILSVASVNTVNNIQYFRVYTPLEEWLLATHPNNTHTHTALYRNCEINSEALNSIQWG